MSLILENNPKNKNVVRVLRFAVFLACLFKGFQSADSYYNNPSLIAGVNMNGVGFYIAVIAVVGLMNFLFTMLCASLSYSILLKSKWVPTNSEGLCGVSYCTFHFIFCICVISGFLVQGALGLIMYFYPISSALLSLVIMRAVTLLIIIMLNLLLMTVVPKDKKKEMFVSMLFPNIFALLFLG